MKQRNYGIITNEQAEYLLKLPKKVLLDNEEVDNFTLAQTFPFNMRIELVSPNDDEFTFLWVIHQSSKISIRISLHIQENDSKTGLLRLDYNAGHKNPEIISASLPERFHPYVGKEFSNNEHHIHYHVEGYKSLAWAIPLVDDTLGAIVLDETNLNSSLIDTIHLFAKIIHLETKININRRVI